MSVSLLIRQAPVVSGGADNSITFLKGSSAKNPNSAGTMRIIIVIKLFLTCYLRNDRVDGGSAACLFMS
jgi:hypothetical protein